MQGISGALRDALNARVVRPSVRLIATWCSNALFGGTMTPTGTSKDADCWPIEDICDGVDFPAFKWAILDSRVHADEGWRVTGPKTNGWEKGWWSGAKSDGSGNFATPPIVQVAYSQARKGTKVRICSDSIYGWIKTFNLYYRISAGGSWIQWGGTHTATSELTEIDLGSEQVWWGLRLDILSTNLANDWARVGELDFVWQEDISARVIEVTMRRERELNNQGTLPLGHAAAASLDLKLENSDRHLSRHNTTSPYYGYLRENIRLELDYGYWTGLAYEYIPQGIFYVDEWPDSSAIDVAVRGRDGSKFLQGTSCGPNLYEGRRRDWIAKDLCHRANLRAEQLVVDAMAQTAAYVWFDATQTLWDALLELAVAERGAFYFDEAGVFRFENSTHLAGHAKVLDLGTATHIISGSLTEREKCNVVVVEVPPPVLAAEQDLWTNPEELTIVAGSPQTFSGTWSKAPAQAVTNVVVPVEQVIADVHTPVWIDYVWNWHDRYGFSITFSSASGSAVVEQSALKVLGLTVDLGAVVSATAEDANAIRRAGERKELRLTIPWTSSAAQIYADALLAAYAEPTPLLTLETVALPHLQIGDRVGIVYAALGVSANYYIVSIEGRRNGQQMGLITA